MALRHEFLEKFSAAEALIEMIEDDGRVQENQRH